MYQNAQNAHCCLPNECNGNCCKSGWWALSGIKHPASGVSVGNCMLCSPGSSGSSSSLEFSGNISCSPPAGVCFAVASQDSSDILSAIGGRGYVRVGVVNFFARFACAFHSLYLHAAPHFQNRVYAHENSLLSFISFIILVRMRVQDCR